MILVTLLIVTDEERAYYLKKDNTATAIATLLGLAARFLTFLIVSAGILSALLGRPIFPWRFEETRIGVAISIMLIGSMLVFAALFVLISIVQVAISFVLGIHKIPDEFYETTTTDYDQLRYPRNRF